MVADEARDTYYLLAHNLRLLVSLNHEVGLGVRNAQQSVPGRQLLVVEHLLLALVHGPLDDLRQGLAGQGSGSLPLVVLKPIVDPRDACNAVVLACPRA